MIKKLVIDNFKSIEHVEVSCANLNLFVGTNSSGKSTILQALLLLAQHTSFSQGLSGELVSLGSYDDSKCKYSGKKNIGSYPKPPVPFASSILLIKHPSIVSCAI